jgi:hypothetical protein
LTTTAREPIAITGVGAVTAAGRGAAALRRALRERRSFLGPVPRLVRRELPVTAGGAVPGHALPAAGPGDDHHNATAALRVFTPAATFSARAPRRARSMKPA